MNTEEHQQQLTTALTQIMLQSGIEIRLWSQTDFPTIQRLSLAEGWTSPTQRTADSLLAWPALVAVENERVVGFVRGLTDGAITMYIAEMAVDVRLRGRDIGRGLLDACHSLYPTSRLDLLTADDARAFYKACGFRVIHDGMRKSYVSKAELYSSWDKVFHASFGRCGFDDSKSTIRHFFVLPRVGYQV